MIDNLGKNYKKHVLEIKKGEAGRILMELRDNNIISAAAMGIILNRIDDLKEEIKSLEED